MKPNNSRGDVRKKQQTKEGARDDEMEEEAAKWQKRLKMREGFVRQEWRWEGTFYSY